MTGRNVVGAESAVVASVRIPARRGSNTARTLVAPYSGDQASVGKVSGFTSYSQLSVTPWRAGDVVVLRVEITLDSQVDELQESIDVTAC